MSSTRTCARNGCAATPIAALTARAISAGRRRAASAASASRRARCRPGGRCSSSAARGWRRRPPSRRRSSRRPSPSGPGSGKPSLAPMNTTTASGWRSRTCWVRELAPVDEPALRDARCPRAGRAARRRRRRSRQPPRGLASSGIASESPVTSSVSSGARRLGLGAQLGRVERVRASPPARRPRAAFGVESKPPSLAHVRRRSRKASASSPHSSNGSRSPPSRRACRPPRTTSRSKPGCISSPAVRTDGALEEHEQHHGEEHDHERVARRGRAGRAGGWGRVGSGGSGTVRTGSR